MKTGYVYELVGNTPLIKIKSLSNYAGCEILAKAEFLNPGGSIKDRTALGIILKAEQDGLLKKGYTLIEGTAGNTGIGLATLAAQKGYRCIIVMPNNQSQEKYQTLQALGAKVITVPPCPFSNPDHFYHTAKRLAESTPHSFWATQFENTANFDIHYKTTGPEIWQQTDGSINAFVASVGTGGTFAGVSKYLKEQNPAVHTCVADPLGSGIHAYIKTGVLKSEGSSITEGIGIMRLTENFKLAHADDSIQVTDQNMISMLYHLSKFDGLIVGTSAALNIYASLQFALKNRDKCLKIVTIIGDSGLRYQSKIFNPDFLKQNNLDPNIPIL
ncbi:MAG: cysteine synthase A [Pseudobdellovibrio sp.]